MQSRGPVFAYLEGNDHTESQLCSRAADGAGKNTAETAEGAPALYKLVLSLTVNPLPRALALAGLVFLHR